MTSKYIPEISLEIVVLVSHSVKGESEAIAHD
jgi:hypothetical protein